MSLTNTTGDDEQILLEKLVLKIKNVLSVLNVFDRRRSVASVQDAVRKLMVKPDEKKETRYAMLEFLGYDDSDIEGDEDCKICILIYRLRFFFQFVDVRPNGSNSAREFTAANLEIRKDFMQSPDIFSDDDPAVVIGRLEPMTRDGFAATGEDIETGIDGHSINYIVRLKHYGN